MYKNLEIDLGSESVVRRPETVAQTRLRALTLRPVLARPRAASVGLLEAVKHASKLRAMARMRLAMNTMWMAFQPIVDTTSRRIFAYEALMRNDEPSLALPGDVLRMAERLGCIQELGRRTRALTADAFSCAPADAVFFVNLHTRDLLDPELYETRAPLTRFAGRVVLEITERVSIDGIEDIEARLVALRNRGFRIAIDDLGAGYSGLSACVQVEPEFAKLDMFLVRKIHESTTRQRLVETIMTMCEGMHMKIIAEGVELAGERDRLRAIDCSLMQGFLFARPARDFPDVATFQ